MNLAVNCLDKFFNFEKTDCAEEPGCMSMYNDIVWEERGNTEKRMTNSVTVANYARRLLLGRWSFLGLGSEKKPILINQMDKTAE